MDRYTGPAVYTKSGLLLTGTQNQLWVVWNVPPRKEQPAPKAPVTKLTDGIGHGPAHAEGRVKQLQAELSLAQTRLETLEKEYRDTLDALENAMKTPPPHFANSPRLASLQKMLHEADAEATTYLGERNALALQLGEVTRVLNRAGVTLKIGDQLLTPTGRVQVLVDELNQHRTPPAKTAV